VIRTIQDDDLLTNSQQMGKRLQQGLEVIAERSPHIGHVRGRGLLQGLELVRDKASLAPLAGGSYRLQALAHDRQMMIYSCPTPLADLVIEAVMLAPPLTIDEDDVDEILNRLSDSVDQLDRDVVV
jgi:4-aminobutyrate aminotransferase-like enzyme